MRAVLRWFLGVVVAGVLSTFAALLLHGEYFAEGPVVFTLSHSHGIHRGDILVAGGWLIGMIALVAVLLDRPSAGRGSARPERAEKR